MPGKGLESLIPKKGKQGPDRLPQGSSTPSVYHTDEGSVASPRPPANLPRHGQSFPFPYQAQPFHRESPGFEAPTTPTEPVAAPPPPPRPGHERPAPAVASWKDHSLDGSIFHIELEKIRPNPYQPRRDFEPRALEELAQSIREFGILQPLIVSKVVHETEHGTDVEYQLIAGERRFMAAKLLGLPHVPAIVRQVATPHVKLEMALIENLQRSDLSPLEAARAYVRLQEEFGLTQREIAVRVGKSREVIANTIRLLNLPAGAQQALVEGRIKQSQARVLLSVADPRDRERLAGELVRTRTTVRQLHGKVAPAHDSDPEQRYWERQLEEKIGAPVKVVKSGGRGKVIIQFFSDEEWRSIVEKLVGKEG